MIAGQYLDLAARRRRPRPTRTAPASVALLKSARYTVTRPLLLGAALAPAPPAPASPPPCRAYGDAVGMAFQLRDDVLGLFGDPTETGKSCLDDLREGKRTLLVLRALAPGRRRPALPAAERASATRDLDEAQADRCPRDRGRHRRAGLGRGAASPPSTPSPCAAIVGLPEPARASPRPTWPTSRSCRPRMTRASSSSAPGLGGLSAACHLAGAGHDVTVVEAADVPGGRAGTLDATAATGSTPGRPC